MKKHLLSLRFVTEEDESHVHRYLALKYQASGRRIRTPRPTATPHFNVCEPDGAVYQATVQEAFPVGKIEESAPVVQYMGETPIVALCSYRDDHGEEVFFVIRCDLVSLTGPITVRQPELLVGKVMITDAEADELLADLEATFQEEASDDDE